VNQWCFRKTFPCPSHLQVDGVALVEVPGRHAGDVEGPGPGQQGQQQQGQPRLLQTHTDTTSHACVCVCVCENNPGYRPAARQRGFAVMKTRK